MNLTNLFEAQKKLRERINYNGEDRFEKLILALLVEISECANEQRTWKFWSTDQEPRTTAKCRYCGGKGEGYFSGNEYTGLKEKCIRCDGTGVNDTENPLLEEYVDGLHFVLEIGIELKVNPNSRFIEPSRDERLNEPVIVFHQIFGCASNVMWNHHYKSDGYADYIELMQAFLRLGELFGFSWEQIEQAYFDKNQINHSRQENGY